MKPVSQILKQQETGLSKLNCHEVIASCGINLEQRGNHFVAMCPIHGDIKDPSLTIYPDTNSWCCFSAKCINHKYPGKINGGSAIDFLMQYRNFNYGEAKDWLLLNFNLIKPVTIKKVIKNNTPITIKDVLYYHSLLDQNNKRSYFYNRGFNDETINIQKFGYNGKSYIIPIWESRPSYSPVLSIKKRRVNYEHGAKYIRIGEYSTALYSCWYCFKSKTILAFAGELDCALANQYGLPSFSLINGAKGWKQLPDDWPNLYFPNSDSLIMVFDRKEEVVAGNMASSWEKVKGRFTSKIVHYPTEFKGTDFNEFILEQGYSKFCSLIEWNEW